MWSIDSNLFIDLLGCVFYIALIIHSVYALFRLRHDHGRSRCKITLIAFIFIAPVYIVQILTDIFSNMHDDGLLMWNVFNYLQAIVSLMAVQVMTLEHGINLRQKYPRIPGAGIL